MAQAQPTLHLEPIRTTHVHSAPALARVAPVLARSIYRPSPDRVDANLLLLFHGLGDTAAPFAQLGTSLNLPQTAILSVQGPERVPLLEEEAYQWWDSFDALGELIAHPNPAATLHLLVTLLEHLTAPTVIPAASSSSSSGPSSGSAAAPAVPGCGWHPSQIHLFGYGQGGTCAGELALAWARAHPISSSSSSSSSSAASPTADSSAHLGSVVAVSAPLLSHPTPSPSTRARTRALVLSRPAEVRAVGATTTWPRGFVRSDAVTLPMASGFGSSGSGGEGMLRGRGEWEPVMRFWSECLTRKSALELKADDGEVYRVTGGANPFSTASSASSSSAASGGTAPNPARPP